MRSITGIILHCTATRADWWAGKRTSEKVAEIRRWHVEERGWSDIGYHFLVDRDGTVAQGRPIERAGAHTRGNNRETVGIALFGGHGSSVHDIFSENFTQAQDDALRGLIARLKAEHGELRVSGHNDYAAKACPGFQAGEWFASKDVCGVAV